MNEKILTTLILSGVIISGCATGPNGDNCGLGVQGEISFSKNGTNYCQITGNYTNTSSGVVKPVVEITLFDESDNTLVQRTIYFDQILPGKKQEKSTPTTAPCSKVRKALVQRAYNDTGGGYVFRICGVDGRSSSWAK